MGGWEGRRKEGTGVGRKGRRWMDGWMNGYVNGWMGRWKDEWVGGWMGM